MGPSYLDTWKKERRNLPLSVLNETRIDLERKRALVQGTLPVEHIIEGLTLLRIQKDVLRKKIGRLTLLTLINSILFILLLLKESL